MRLTALHRRRWHDGGARLRRNSHTRAAESPSKAPCGRRPKPCVGATVYRGALAERGRCRSLASEGQWLRGLIQPRAIQAASFPSVDGRLQACCCYAAWRMCAAAQGDHPPGLLTRPKPRRGLCCERSGPGPDRSVHSGVDTDAPPLAARPPRGHAGSTSSADGFPTARHRNWCRGDFSLSGPGGPAGWTLGAVRPRLSGPPREGSATRHLPPPPFQGGRISL